MIRLLASYLRPYRPQLAIVIVLLLVQAIANLYLPALNADIINDGVVLGDVDAILRIGAVMLAVSVALGAASIVGVYWSARVAMGFGRDVRSAIFRSVESFSQAEVNRFGTPSLITRNTNDVQQVQTVVLLGLTVMISAPILALGGVFMALRQDVPLTGLLLVILPVMFVIIAVVLRRALPLFVAMQVKIDRINQVMRETLSGVRVIRAFVRTRHEEARFDAANRDLTLTALAVNRLFAFTMPALMAIMNLSGVAIIWFGAGRVDSGEMPIGNLVAFLQYLMQILMAVLMAVIMFVMVPRAAVSAGRINDVLETVPSIRDPEGPVVSPARTGHVEFRNVEFRYPGAQDPVLREVSFFARPGETTAIVGSTGSGKSTLVILLTRFYDVTGGQVLVDGVDVRALHRDDLWRRIGIVPQKAFLFAGSVADNLRYGDAGAEEAQLWAALEIAQAADFVRDMPEGLATTIAQGGASVSGGQRQRLAIARALVRAPDVFVFDDSFSALDFRTDARLRAALARELGGATVIIVAQRVGTIMHADRIVVLEDGAVAGIGTHAELLASSPTYREIVSSQLTPEEAA
jgi:ATP-binding cassette, subfamily B, multidrug efflux pump